MKTFARLIRHYILAAVGLSFLLVVLLGVAYIWLGVYFGTKWQKEFAYSYKEISSHLQQDEQGNLFFAEKTAEQWMEGYAWAMVLDDSGQVIWQHQLPQELNRKYTPNDVAVFSRWYLGEYPVFCQVKDYGLFVLGMPQGSIAKYNFWTYPEVIQGLLYGSGLFILAALLLILGLCVVFGWRGTKSLKAVTEGLDRLAEGQTVELPTRGFAAELTEKLNRTSAQLRSRNEIIARRDTARTQWIAGVSHDIRTPLALILGWAEQMQVDPELSDAARQKAEGIQRQSEKIKSLIEDLNLTSKLQYGVQPLRREKVQAGPLLRKLVADFCNGPLGSQCTVELVLQEEAEKAVLQADTALLARALENVLGNSVRHNTKLVRCEVEGLMEDGNLLIRCTDDGIGFPEPVLKAMKNRIVEENTPHILGMHVVEQIIQAHGGSVSWGQRQPHGSAVVMRLPTE